MNTQRFRTAVDSLFRPIDIASLVYLRVIFGLVMLWEVWRYFDHNRIYRYWIEPKVHFSYPGLEWLAPLPGEGMPWLFFGLGILSLLIIAGLFYRVATVAFFFGFLYMFLLEQGQYLNHFYFVCLLSFLMIFIPANRCCSLDTRLGITRPSDTAPAWTLWIVRFQVGIVYFFGGIAKMNGDWLAGEPLRNWLEGRSHYPIIGDFLPLEPIVMAMAWGGTLFDLLIPFFLLYRPTRLPSFIVVIAFHVTNAILWNIGIFPWLTIALSAIFFDPSWPRRFFRLPRYRKRATEPTGWFRRLAFTGIAIYVAAQILVPLRHWVYPGDVKWTEEGHRFAWRMKLRSRDGHAEIFVREKGTRQNETINLRDYLLPWQIDEMATRPDMLLFFAKYLKRDLLEKRGKIYSVHAHSFISVNGRAEQVYFSSDWDLAEISRFGRRSEWMYPFQNTPLPMDAGTIALD